jgi:hypothetical protein
VTQREKRAHDKKLLRLLLLLLRARQAQCAMLSFE